MYAVANWRPSATNARASTHQSGDSRFGRFVAAPAVLLDLATRWLPGSTQTREVRINQLGKYLNLLRMFAAPSSVWYDPHRSQQTRVERWDLQILIEFCGATRLKPVAASSARPSTDGWQLAASRGPFASASAPLAGGSMTSPRGSKPATWQAPGTADTPRLRGVSPPGACTG